MNPHNFSIYACGLCGVLMVVGSIWLLKSGIIKLTDATNSQALSIELIKKIKLNTTYPALALFVIGLLFVALGVWFSQADVVAPWKPLAIVGKIQGVEDANLVTVTIQPDGYEAFNFGADSDGSVDKILPDIKQLRLKITANGYRPQTYEKMLNIDKAEDQSERRLLKLPEDVRFTKITSGPVTVNSPPQPGKIEALPPHAKIEPLRVAAKERPHGDSASSKPNSSGP